MAVRPDCSARSSAPSSAGCCASGRHIALRPSPAAMGATRCFCNPCRADPAFGGISSARAMTSTLAWEKFGRVGILDIDVARQDVVLLEPGGVSVPTLLGLRAEHHTAVV